MTADNLLERKSAEIKKDLVPIKELTTPDGYRWFVYSEEDTGLRLVCLEDIKTGVVVTTTIANPEKRTAAHKAWAGARHSRAAGMPWEIMNEMGEKGVDPDQKLDELFSTYGHASVGDMARLEVDVVRCPMHLCYTLFNSTSINSGQEKSTRYQQKFGKAILHNIRHYLPENFSEDELVTLETRYQEFGEMSLKLFSKHKDLITSEFLKFYQPEDKKQEGSLNSRVLDCVRYFLLFGQSSGLSLETSARDWSRVIGELKASPIQFHAKFASQLERLLAPSKEEEEILGFKAEAPGLLRHTEPSTVANDNIQALKVHIENNTNLLTTVNIDKHFEGKVNQSVKLLSKKYTEGDKVAAQYLLRIWPGLDAGQLMDWVHDQSDGIKRQIGKVIFNGHNNYKEPPIMAKATNMTLLFESFLGEVRDFNRHRAWGREVTLPLVFGLPIDFDTTSQILSKGFGLPLYLSEIPEFQDLAEEFEADLIGYYKKLYDFVGVIHQTYGSNIDYSFVINLLPLAHRVTMFMHGDPKQALYMTHQRSRNGGHINYRVLAYESNLLISQSDPYLEGMVLSSQAPNPANREEFFDRS